MSAVNTFKISDVKSFRGHAVDNGRVLVSDQDFIGHLRETHGEVIVCGVTVCSGLTLEAVAPILFKSRKIDYEEDLQNMLATQIHHQNDVDIETL